jgi:hypothetical protein
MSCISFFIALSMHVGLENNYNNLHPHVRCDQDSYIFGSFINSEEKVSNYIGKDFNGLELGIVSGYYYDLVPMIRYKKNNFFIAPAYEVHGKVGITIGMEVQL